MAPVRTNTLQLLAYSALSTSGMIIPLYADHVGADFRMIGLIGAATGAATVLAETLFGRLGDRFDRRRLLLLGFLATSIAYALQLLATTPQLLLVSRFLCGLASGMIPATLAAYVFDVRRPLGKFTSYNAMGWLLGSGLVIAVGHVPDDFSWGPYLDAGPYQVLFLLSSAFSLLGLFAARGLPPMHVGIGGPWFAWHVVAQNAHVYLPMFLRHLGATTVWVVFPLYVVALGGDLALVGWLHVANMVTQILVLRTAERFPTLSRPSVLVGTGLILSTVTFAGFAVAQNAYQLIPFQFLVGASFACLFLGSLKEVMENNVERATATGLLNASMGLSNVVGPIMGGIVAATHGFHAAIWLGAAITLVGFLYFIATTRKDRGQRQPPPTPLVTRGPTGDVQP